ncbi:MAG: hypothetical protein LC640_06510, partial [Frankia sp.]|nr:hypothetical protein [Frankia sp.]
VSRLRRATASDEPGEDVLVGDELSALAAGDVDVDATAAATADEEVVEPPQLAPEAARPRLHAVSSDSFTDSLARASEALSALLSDAPPAPDTDLSPTPAWTTQEPDPDELERERLREAARQELVAAQLEAEALRQAELAQTSRRADVATSAAEEPVSVSSFDEYFGGGAATDAVDDITAALRETLDLPATGTAAASDSDDEPDDVVEAETPAVDERASAVARGAAAATFREMNEASRAGAEPTTEAAEEESAADVDEAAEPEPEPAAAGFTDTASLLRELSSLGFENEPGAPATPRGGGNGASPRSAPARRPAPAEKPKKRKGLFGLGS